jgi:hypothetical protein
LAFYDDTTTNSFCRRNPELPCFELAQGGEIVWHSESPERRQRNSIDSKRCEMSHQKYLPILFNPIPACRGSWPCRSVTCGTIGSIGVPGLAISKSKSLSGSHSPCVATVFRIGCSDHLISVSNVNNGIRNLNSPKTLVLPASISYEVGNSGLCASDIAGAAARCCMRVCMKSPNHYLPNCEVQCSFYK